MNWEKFDLLISILATTSMNEQFPSSLFILSVYFSRSLILFKKDLRAEISFMLSAINVTVIFSFSMLIRSKDISLIELLLHFNCRLTWQHFLVVAWRHSWHVKAIQSEVLINEKLQQQNWKIQSEKGWNSKFTIWVLLLL